MVWDVSGVWGLGRAEGARRKFELRGGFQWISVDFGGARSVRESGGKSGERAERERRERGSGEKAERKRRESGEKVKSK